LEPLAKYLMVEALILNIQALGEAVHQPQTTDTVIAGIKLNFDRFGPYEFARQQNLLVLGSGEEFAVQFMGFFNEYSERQVY